MLKSTTKWRPMDSAPRDGTRIVAYATRPGNDGPPQLVICAFHYGQWWVMGTASHGGLGEQKLDLCEPFCWRHCFAPPNIEVLQQIRDRL